MRARPRLRRVLAASVAAVTTALAGLAINTSIANADTTPDTIEVTLEPAQTSAPQNVTVDVPRIIPKADVVFAFDLTGSMGAELSSAKSNATAIMNNLDTKIADARYGVISHADYPHAYDSYGYEAMYGQASAGDFAYRRDLALTTVRADVNTAIDGLSLVYGGDGPESYSRLLYESYADAGIGWRTGARRILIHIGDNVPHDNNICEGVGSCSFASFPSTGGDPGRDEVMFTLDDLDLQTVLADVATNGVALFELFSGPTGDLPLWQNWAARTGGEALALSNASNLPDLIAQAVESSAATVQNLALVPGGAYASWASVSPASYSNVATPAVRDFAVTFTPPLGTPDGDYLIPLDAIGDGANFGTTLATVHVISNAGPTITSITGPSDPTPVGTPVTVTTAFTDPDAADTHTATYSWGDGATSNPTVTPGARTVDGTHTYSVPGVYAVTVTITDDSGESDTEVLQYVVVYDPNGGYVTGGGWINSPAGAYRADPASSGRASFGFVSRYKKGTQPAPPEGETEFQLKGDGFTFHSDAYEWLIINGAKARYRGTGSVNGVSGYGFQLTAWDGNANGGGGTDRIRMKIWDASGALVYDNQQGSADDAAPSTALGGGSIVIHK